MKSNLPTMALSESGAEPCPRLRDGSKERTGRRNRQTGIQRQGAKEQRRQLSFYFFSEKSSRTNTLLQVS